MSVTRTDIRREVLRRVLGPLSFHTGTATTDSSISLVDVSNDGVLRNSLLADSRWEGSYFYRPYSTDASDRLRVITGFTTTASLTPSYAWTVSPGTTATTGNNVFELIQSAVLYPDEVHRHIERALKRMFHEVYEPLSLLADAGMEDSGTSSWTGTGATVTKDTDAGDAPEMGMQSLSVATTAANGYAQSASYRVSEGDNFNLWVDLRAPACTARVRVIDVTNSNNSIATETWTDGDWGMVQTGFSIPTGCDQIAVRLGADETGVNPHFDNAILMQSGRIGYNLPSWLTNPRMWIYQVLAASWTYGPRQRLLTPVKYDVMQDETAANAGVVRVWRQAQPMFIRALRPYLTDTGTLASETTTVNVDLDWLAKSVEVQCYDVLRISGSIQNAEVFEARYRQALLDKRAMDASFMPRRPSEPY